MSEVELWTDDDWISPYVFSAFVALTEKGVVFDARAVSLDLGQQNEPAYRDASITARVPALRHGDFWLSESTAIVEYVDEVFPGVHLLPRDPHERARVRQVMGWVRSDLGALREERPTTTMFFERAHTPLSEAGELAAKKLVRVALALVPEGRDSIGQHWSIGDADLAFMLHRLILNGHPVPSRLMAYASATWRRASVRAFVDRPRTKR